MASEATVGLGLCLVSVGSVVIGDSSMVGVMVKS